jgi:hypothetical protein
MRIFPFENSADFLNNFFQTTDFSNDRLFKRQKR